jgi:hypothetical protein
MLTLFVVVYGISQRPTLQTAVGDLAQCIAFLDIAVFAFYYILYLSMRLFGLYIYVYINSDLKMI